MLTYFLRLFSIVLLAIGLMSCATMKATSQNAYLQQGKGYFEAGYYRRAMQILLPLACDNVPDAQYAVGYMYYYGYGVAQDTDTGTFWIRRAADQKFQPAAQALQMITADPKR